MLKNGNAAPNGGNRRIHQRNFVNRTAPTASASAPACGSLPVAPLLAFYATRDGQSRRIAAHIVDRLAERGIPAIAQDLAAASPPPADLARASLVLVVASVRYGRHLPEAVRFLASYATLASP